MSRTAFVRRVSLFACVVLAFVAFNVALAGRAPEVRIVNMLDRCDPATFNAAFGAGTCIFEHPGVSLETFISVLTSAQSIGSWHFSPREVHLRSGQQYQAQNDGGEVHTFTEVAEFGGGFIPELNELSGTPVPAPECLNFPGIEFIPAGASGTPEADAPGTHKYMCCIHPWMRATVTVR